MPATRTFPARAALDARTPTMPDTPPAIWPSAASSLRVRWESVQRCCSTRRPGPVTARAARPWRWSARRLAQDSVWRAQLVFDRADTGRADEKDCAKDRVGAALGAAGVHLVPWFEGRRR